MKGDNCEKCNIPFYFWIFLVIGNCSIKVSLDSSKYFTCFSWHRSNCTVYWWRHCLFVLPLFSWSLDVLNRIANYQTAFSLHRKENPKLTIKTVSEHFKKLFSPKGPSLGHKDNWWQFSCDEFWKRSDSFETYIVTLYLLINGSFNGWGGLDAKDVTNLSEISWDNHRFLCCNHANFNSVIIVSGQVLACDKQWKFCSWKELHLRCRA